MKNLLQNHHNILRQLAYLALLTFIPELSIANDTSSIPSSYCIVHLKVTSKDANMVLGQNYVGPDPDGRQTIVLELEGNVPNNKQCESYQNISSVTLSSLLPKDELYEIEKGDILTASIHPHAPSPYGKYLKPEYHYSLYFYEHKRGNTTKIFKPPVYHQHPGIFRKKAKK